MKYINKIMYSFLSLLVVLVPGVAFAHCPLCVAGAGALAVLAASLGISTIVVGLFVGAFSLALGIWVARLIRKKYIKFQDVLLTIIIFATTVLPIMPLIREYRPLYIDIYGSYGTILHNTYVINLYLWGSILGAALLFVSPYLSEYLTRSRGKKIPFQSMIITFILLLIFGVILQFTVGVKNE